MGVAHISLVHCNPYGCKIKGIRAVFSIERNVSRRHLQGAPQLMACAFLMEAILIVRMKKSLKV